MLNEIKLALRGLTKSPGFTIIAIAMLALTIGANSAVFSLINALLVRPLPHQQPAKLALSWEQFASQALDRIPVSPPEYPFDPTTFIFVTITLAAVALLASYIPALRATRADPIIALSHNARP
jgi:ABC-type antimicrobial peptide transport system permease subunit